VLADIRTWSCIAAIGIAARWVGIFGESAVWDYLSFGSDEIGSILYVLSLICRNIVEIGNISYKVSPFGLFFEQKPTTGHSVIQWQCLYRYAVVFEYYTMFPRIYAMEK
jgi:hypothetical protein